MRQLTFAQRIKNRAKVSTAVLQRAQNNVVGNRVKQRKNLQAKPAVLRQVQPAVDVAASPEASDVSDKLQRATAISKFAPLQMSPKAIEGNVTGRKYAIDPSSSAEVNRAAGTIQRYELPREILNQQVSQTPPVQHQPSNYLSPTEFQETIMRSIQGSAFDQTMDQRPTADSAPVNSPNNSVAPPVSKAHYLRQKLQRQVAQQGGTAHVQRELQQAPPSVAAGVQPSGQSESPLPAQSTTPPTEAQIHAHLARRDRSSVADQIAARIQRTADATAQPATGAAQNAPNPTPTSESTAQLLSRTGVKPSEAQIRAHLSRKDGVSIADQISARIQRAAAETPKVQDDSEGTRAFKFSADRPSVADLLTARRKAANPKSIDRATAESNSETRSETQKPIRRKVRSEREYISTSALHRLNKVSSTDSPATSVDKLARQTGAIKPVDPPTPRIENMSRTVDASSVQRSSSARNSTTNKGGGGRSTNDPPDDSDGEPASLATAQPDLEFANSKPNPSTVDVQAARMLSTPPNQEAFMPTSIERNAPLSSVPDISRETDDTHDTVMSNPTVVPAMTSDDSSTVVEKISATQRLLKPQQSSTIQRSSLEERDINLGLLAQPTLPPAQLIQTTTETASTVRRSVADNAVDKEDLDSTAIDPIGDFDSSQLVRSANAESTAANTSQRQTNDPNGQLNLNSNVHAFSQTVDNETEASASQIKPVGQSEAIQRSFVARPAAKTKALSQLAANARAGSSKTENLATGATTAQVDRNFEDALPSVALSQNDAGTDRSMVSVQRDDKTLGISKATQGSSIRRATRPVSTGVQVNMPLSTSAAQTKSLSQGVNAKAKPARTETYTNQTIQREAIMPEAADDSDDENDMDGGSTPEALDFQSIAADVLPLVKQLLAIERERSF